MSKEARARAVPPVTPSSRGQHFSTLLGRCPHAGSGAGPGSLKPLQAARPSVRPSVGPSARQTFARLGIRPYVTAPDPRHGPAQAEPPPGAQAQRATALRLQQASRDEQGHWSRRYASDALFRQRIDEIARGQRVLLQRIEQRSLSPTQIIEEAEKLAKLTLIAVGLASDAGWTASTLEDFARGGRAYARPSQQANWFMQLPGLARSLAQVAARLADYTGQDPALTQALGQLAAVVGAIYLLVQPLALVGAPFANANAQSEAVALQAQAVRQWMLVFSSSKLVKPDGSNGTLRPPAAVLAEWQALKTLKACIGCGQPLAEWESDALLRQLDAALAAETDPQAQALWHQVIQDLEHGRWTPQAEGLLQRLALEAAVSELYVRINVQTHQGLSRALRSLMNLLTAALGTLALRTRMAQREQPGTVPALAPVWLELLGLGTQSLQVLLYQGLHGRAAAKDALNRLADQFAIAVLTQLRLFSPEGRVDLQRLDKAFKSPLQLRLDNAQAMARFDRGVYGNAIASLLLSHEAQVPQRGARRIDLALPDQAAPRSFAVELSLVGLHRALAQAGSADARQAMLKGLSAQLGLPAAQQASVLRIAELYERNETTLACLQGRKLVELLDPEHSPLPPLSRQRLVNALCHALDGDPASADDDRWLAKGKGDADRYGKDSVYQVAQKVGMAAALLICGSLGPNGAKYVSQLAALIAQGLLLACGSQPQRVARIGDHIRVAGLGVGMAGALLAIGLGFNSHLNIALKNQQRQQGEKFGDISHSGLPGHSARSFSLKPNLARWRNEVDVFEPLLGAPIAPEDMQALPELDIELFTDLLGAVKDQAFAVPLRKIFTGWRHPHGGLHTDSADEILRAMREALGELERAIGAGQGPAAQA